MNPSSTKTGRHQAQGFVEPWPTSGAPKDSQVDSRRPTLKTAPRQASSPTPTATPPEVSKQVTGSPWLEWPPPGTPGLSSHTGGCWSTPHHHLRESLFCTCPVAKVVFSISFCDDMSVPGGPSLNVKGHYHIKYALSNHIGFPGPLRFPVPGNFINSVLVAHTASGHASHSVVLHLPSCAALSFLRKELGLTDLCIFQSQKEAKASRGRLGAYPGGGRVTPRT